MPEDLKEIIEELSKRVERLEALNRESVPKHQVQNKEHNHIKRDPDNIKASELKENEINVVTNPNDNKVYIVVRSDNVVKKVELP